MDEIFQCCKGTRERESGFSESIATTVYEAIQLIDKIFPNEFFPGVIGGGQGRAQRKTIRELCCLFTIISASFPLF